MGIDSIAGPSEILVIADKDADPEWVAYDLLSQSEHDKNASAFLITDSNDFAIGVKNKIELILPTLKRKEITSYSWNKNGKIFVVDSIVTTGIKIANQIAPEHLELIIDKAHDLIPKITNAGAIFIGKYSTEAIGDYIAGSSHVLPTSSTARFSSGLSIYDFLRKSSIIDCPQDSFMNIADDVITFAESETLECHSSSVSIRKNKLS